ncbi:tyrosine-type recombinase/integrase [Aquincola sp. S2]|uniref:Tyrosine-type recombinase/integrase n=1 Tax=Pseudaquabacterium terrae TaxID=2732868 RepID=A0ABX2ECF9_9BURK|nr:phage integrase family protein [Aquabacterium terrae]NRF65578.1 tyrosine-type recombinase/integrase [Aquabacterium terrae]
MNRTPDLFDPRALTPAPPPAAARRRKLHAGHFAFMRALVQGLDWTQSWQRYLRLEGEASDRRTVRSTIAWMRDEFAAAARREQRFGTARLVLLDAARLPEVAAPALPSLEDFAASHGLEDFSQSEQQASYEAVFGRATHRQRRRARLIARQLEALHWLELRVAEPPRATDPLAFWLNPALATPLEAAGLLTLADLVARINGIGQRWHRPMRGLGDIKAQRIVEWLKAHRPSTGLVLGEHTARPRSQLAAAELDALVNPASDVRPGPKFVVPTALDGRTGRHRAPRASCLIDADTDRQAIDAWLASKAGQGRAHTQRACRKEAERFVLWAVLERRCALSSIEPADCLAYRDFLADPQPRDRWCGARGRPRWSPLWRPFEGPLSAAARRQALTALKNLFGFLADRRYLIGNPWALTDAAATAGPKLDPQRCLDAAQAACVRAAIDAAHGVPSSAQRRLGLAWRLLQATGMRPSEAVSATADQLLRSHLPPEPGDEAALAVWLLRIAGPGQRARELPLPDALIDELGDYLASRGLPRDPLHPDNRGTHLLGRATDLAVRAPNLPTADKPVDPRAGIGTSTLYRQLKRCFADAAATLRAQGDDAGAQQLARASTHWLRHSHARRSLDHGLPLPLLQQQLGHAALSTTAAYERHGTRRRLLAAQAVLRAESFTATEPSGNER